MVASEYAAMAAPRICPLSYLLERYPLGEVFIDTETMINAKQALLCFSIYPAFPPLAGLSLIHVAQIWAYANLISE